MSHERDEMAEIHNKSLNVSGYSCMAEKEEAEQVEEGEDEEKENPVWHFSSKAVFALQLINFRGS